MTDPFRTKELIQAIDEAHSLHRILTPKRQGHNHPELSKSVLENEESIAFQFLYIMDHIDELLSEVKMGRGIQSLPDHYVYRLRDELEPRREQLRPLRNTENDDPQLHVDDSINSTADAEFETPQDGTIFSLFDEIFALVDSGTGPFTPDQIFAIQKVIYTDVFNPDIWTTNINDIEPVLGDDVGRRLPSSVRLRLQEIYRSHVAGNYLAAIALARATLEYTIVDCSSQIGIPAYKSDPNNANRVRPISHLIDDTKDRIPQLTQELETIVESGNQTLHPKKKERLALHPTVIRDMSRSSTNSIRRVTEYLYLGIRL